MSKRSINWRKTVLAALALAICFSAALTHAAAERENGPVGTIPWLLTATSEQNALYEECNLGDACADSLRLALNTDLAIVNGGDLTGNLPPGELSREDFESAIRPDLPLAVAEVSVARLRQILESALSHVRLTPDRQYDAENSGHGAFPHISGFTLAYDPGEPAGRRVVWIKYGDERLDLTDTELSFTLAATEYMLGGGYELPAVPGAKTTEYTLRLAMERYIRAGMDDYSRPARRITAIGMKITAYQKNTGLIFVAVACIMIALLYPTIKTVRKSVRRK
ncbi:MAG: hypothetical protein GXX89_10525 [Clostridiales bacterium]|nr:hypothetical protein [Clostridiales bacterium]